MTQQDRTAFMSLSALTDAGYILFQEGGRLGVWIRNTHHNVDYQFALLGGPLEYRASRDGGAISRDELLDQTPIDEFELRSAEVALTHLQGAVGDELVELMSSGWEFPDDGRVSFALAEDMAGEVMGLVAYLDRKEHVVFELDDRPVERDDALAWLQRVEREEAERNLALLDDLMSKLRR